MKKTAITLAFLLASSSVALAQTAVLFASAGHVVLAPSHVSATSQAPAAARQGAVLLASAGQAALEPGGMIWVHDEPRSVER